MKLLMKKAGAGHAERRTASRCCATPTATASPRRATVFLDNLTFAVRHGARRQRPLRRGHRRACCASPTAGGDARSRRRRRKVVDLPAGPLNHHWTKNVIASRDGSKLYVTVGSNSNVARERHRQGERPRGDLGGRSRRPARTASSRRACAIRTAWRGSRNRRAVDGGQRARRARQRPRARLHDVGAGRRLLRLAVQLLRAARRRAREAAAARPRRSARSCPTTRSARIRRRSGLRPAQRLALPDALSRTACSSASTARGTASRAAATR